MMSEFFLFTPLEVLGRKILKQNFSWRDPEIKNYKITIAIDKIPDNIGEVLDSFIEEVIECEHRGKCNEQCATAFKLTASELQFYKTMNIPLPHLCPFCRHFARLKQKNPLRLWHRLCMCNKKNHFHRTDKCQIEFETSYAPSRPEIIYCDSCYKQEIY